MSKLKRIAHRGMIQAAPENTMEAFRAAAEHGYEGVELDIRMTRDGRIVCLHDADLCRLTLARPSGLSTRPVVDLTWEELSRVEIPYANNLLRYFPPDGYRDQKMVHYPWELGTPDEIVAHMDVLLNRILKRGSDNVWRDLCAYVRADWPDALDRLRERETRTARVCLLDDVLRWSLNQPDDFLVEIEYKAPGMIPTLARLLDNSGACGRCVLFTGNEAYNEEIQSYLIRYGRPEGLRLSANLRVPSEVNFERARAWYLDAVDLDAESFTRADVDRFAAMGVDVLSNLGDYPGWWEALVETGAAGFKTNTPAKFTEWRSRRGL